MPPKRSTRSSTRASKGNDDDAAPKQQTLEETGDGVIDTKTGEKRSSPSKDETISADDKKDGTRANKRQKQEAAEKAKIEGGADGIDQASEKAKADGRRIMENQETKKPSRGTLEKGTVYFWYKPKGKICCLSQISPSFGGRQQRSILPVEAYRQDGSCCPTADVIETM